MKRAKQRKVWHLFAGIVFFGLAIAVVMLLWNAIIPGLTGWGTLGYLQAAGLFLLTRILFGGHGPGHWHSRWHGHHDWHNHPGMDEDMKKKMKCMSWDEKREYIRKRMCETHEGEDHHGKRTSESAAGDEQHGA